MSNYSFYSCDRSEVLDAPDDALEADIPQLERVVDGATFTRLPGELLAVHTWVECDFFAINFVLHVALPFLEHGAVGYAV